MAKVKSDIQAEAVARLALKSWANCKADRDSVRDGKCYPDIDLEITGTVGGKQVKFNLSGQVKVGNSTSSTQRPKVESIVSSMLKFMGKEQAQKLVDFVARNRKPPASNAGTTVQAKAILQALSTSSARAGSISFVEEFKC